jgi:HPt (histidine-containing phosphotransfer) domain-containing protein
MSDYYKLDRVREMADNDEDFVQALVAAFLEEVPEDAERLKKAVAEEDYHEAYQAAHKMKPTIDLFELGVLETLIEVQDWGKFEQAEKNVDAQLAEVLEAIDNACMDLRKEFGF